MIDIESDLAGRLPSKTDISYPPREPGIKTSAVLVPLFKEAAIWKMLFTQRSEQVADHRGQVSFPGGRVEPGDTGPLQTALREACEELGIPSEAVRPLGILDPADTRTGFRIWPVVGILTWPVALSPSLPEVRDVFFVPLDWLMHPGHWHFRPVESAPDASPHPAPFFEPYQGRVIWGATAAITVQLMDKLRKGPDG